LSERLPIQNRVRPVVILGVLPLRRCQLRLFNRVEHRRIEQLIAHRLVKLFNMRVLMQITQLNEPQCNAPSVRSLSPFLADVLWPIVTADDCELAPPFINSVLRLGQPACG
jgi:hypothetical protein